MAVWQPTLSWWMLMMLALLLPGDAINLKFLSGTSEPDPTCSTGLISMKSTSQDPQVCCPHYCGECTDYPTCSSVRGQDSAGACCKSKVYDLRCGGGAAANVCLESCSKSLPPCIMDAETEVAQVKQSKRDASGDCNKAIQDWRLKAKAALKPPPGGGGGGDGGDGGDGGGGAAPPPELVAKGQTCRGNNKFMHDVPGADFKPGDSVEKCAAVVRAWKGKELDNGTKCTGVHFTTNVHNGKLYCQCVTNDCSEKNNDEKFTIYKNALL